MGFLHNAAAALKLATFSPEATEINNYVADAHKEAKTEQVNFAADIITDTTHDKILSVADFSKSREKLNGDPKVREKAEKLVNTLVKIKDYDAIKAYLKENIETLDVEVLKTAIVVVIEMQESATNNANYQISEAARLINTADSDPNAKRGYEDAIKSEEEYDKEVSFLISVESYIKDVIATKKLPTAEEKAKGVTNIDDVPNNPALKEIFAKLQLTTKMDGKYLKVFINNKPTNYKIFKPKYDQSYAIYPAPTESVGSFAVIFDKLKKDKVGENGEIIKGQYYLKKFALESGKVQEYGMWDTENDYGEADDSYELAPKQIKSSEKVSMVKN